MAERPRFCPSAAKTPNLFALLRWRCWAWCRVGLGPRATLEREIWAGVGTRGWGVGRTERLRKSCPRRGAAQAAPCLLLGPRGLLSAGHFPLPGTTHLPTGPRTSPSLSVRGTTLQLSSTAGLADMGEGCESSPLSLRGAVTTAHPAEKRKPQRTSAGEAALTCEIPLLKSPEDLAGEKHTKQKKGNRTHSTLSTGRGAALPHTQPGIATSQVKTRAQQAVLISLRK